MKIKVLKYLEIHLIPDGCFGRVYAGYLRVKCPISKENDKIEVVIKELNMNQTDEFTKESEAIKRLSHDRLLMIYG